MGTDGRIKPDVYSHITWKYKHALYSISNQVPPVKRKPWTTLLYWRIVVYSPTTNIVYATFFLRLLQKLVWVCMKNQNYRQNLWALTPYSIAKRTRESNMLRDLLDDKCTVPYVCFRMVWNGDIYYWKRESDSKVFRI